MEKTWNFLSGKKTDLGAILLVLCGILQILAIPAIPTNYIEAIFYLATVLTGTGIVHRKIKGAK